LLHRCEDLHYRKKPTFHQRRLATENPAMPIA